MFHLTGVREQAERRVRAVEHKSLSCIELCKITEVDIKSKTVSAFFFSSGYTKNRVPYTYPSYNGGCGVITTPVVGAVGVAAWDSHGTPIILSFTVPLTADEEGKLSRNLPHMKHLNIPELLEGEVLISSPEGNFMKFDSLGGITLASSLFAFLQLDSDGNGIMRFENGFIDINGTMEEIYTENFIPKMKIVKGRHFYRPTQDSNGSVELYYRVSILDSDEELSFIGLDKDGNIHMKGNVIKYP